MCFPDALKIVRFGHIFIIGNIEQVANYRSISVSLNISKMFERIFYAGPNKYLTDYHIAYYMKTNPASAQHYQPIIFLTASI